MAYQLIDTGQSRSFPEGHPLTANASAVGEVMIIIGAEAGRAYKGLKDRAAFKAVIVELGNECLAVHTGELRCDEQSNVLGFARFRLGRAPPSTLVELVRQSKTSSDALQLARQVFSDSGLATAVCADFTGRIVNRLIRPYYNAALRRLDEGLATAEDLDLTLQLGLGYPEGPIVLLERTGLSEHYTATRALFDAYGTADYAPARRAIVAMMRGASRS